MNQKKDKCWGVEGTEIESIQRVVGVERTI